MYASIASVIVLAATSLVTAIPLDQRHELPHGATPGPCGWDNPPPCTCPAGTYLNQSSTTAIIGAPAPAVSSIMGSFFSTAWFGATPIAISGTNNTSSARRTYPFATPVGETVNITEGIHIYNTLPNGGFMMLFDIANAPVPYGGPGYNGTGAYGGDWDSLIVTSIGANETQINWSIYSCFTGYNDNKAFHEQAIDSVVSILQGQGQITGNNVAPTSTGD